MDDHSADDLEFEKKLGVAIQVLKSRPGWRLAELLARVDADLQSSSITALNRDEHREAAVLRAFDAKAEPYLELVEDEVTRDAYLCLLENFHRSTSVRLAGHKYADAASTEAQRLTRQIETRVQHWRDEAEMRVGRKVLLASPEERQARRYEKYGVLAGWARLTDQIGEFAASLAATQSAQPRRKSAAVDERKDRRAIVDDFLSKCSQVAGFKIPRKRLWMAAGYTNARQFQYWQASDDKGTRASNENFRRILSMKPADFISLLRDKGIAPDKG